MKEDSLKGTQALIHSQTTENIARLIGYTSPVELTLIETAQPFPDYLKIIYYANSGNTAYLPNLIGYLDDLELSRLAFKAICLITGIDVNSPEFILTSSDEIESAVDSRVRFLSSGINKVNQDSVKKSVQSLNLHGKLFLGQTISSNYCGNIIQQGYQLERHIANWHLCHLNNEVKYHDICRFKRINIRK